MLDRSASAIRRKGIILSKLNKILDMIKFEGVRETVARKCYKSIIRWNA